MSVSNMSGVASLAPTLSVQSEIKTISSLMEEMTKDGLLNSTSYRLLKTAVSKLKDFQKLNSSNEKKINKWVYFNISQKAFKKVPLMGG